MHAFCSASSACSLIVWCSCAQAPWWCNWAYRRDRGQETIVGEARQLCASSHVNNWRKSEPLLAARVQLEFLDISNSWWYFRRNYSLEYPIKCRQILYQGSCGWHPSRPDFVCSLAGSRVVACCRWLHVSVVFIARSGPHTLDRPRLCSLEIVTILVTNLLFFPA